MRGTDTSWKCFSLRPLPNNRTRALPLYLRFEFVYLLLLLSLSNPLGYCRQCPQVTGTLFIWTLIRKLLGSLQVWFGFFFILPSPSPQPHLQTRKVAAESRTVAMATSWQLPQWVTVLISRGGRAGGGGALRRERKVTEHLVNMQNHLRSAGCAVNKRKQSHAWSANMDFAH